MEHVVPYSDGAGVVVSVGSAVEDIRVGDRVISNFDATNLYGPVVNGASHQLGGGLDGMLRQYVVLPAAAVAKIPEQCTLDFVQLASLVCAGVTSWNALYGLLPLRAGQVVLLQGTGGVSIFGLQLAKAAGAVTIITTSSDEKLEFVKEKFGADYTITYRTTPDWAAEARRLTNDKELTLSLKTAGPIPVIGFLADVAGLALGKGCIIRGVQIGSNQLMEELVRVVVNQKIQPHIRKTFKFDEESVHAALRCLEAAEHVGKIGISVKKVGED